MSVSWSSTPSKRTAVEGTHADCQDSAHRTTMPDNPSRTSSYMTPKANDERAVARGSRILLAEDDPQLIAMYKRRLKREGYDAIGVSTAEACLERLQTSVVDAIIMDVGLPGMDGMTAMRHIVERYPSLPVIMATGDTNASTAVSALKDGAYDYIVKPIDMQRLLTIVGNAVKSRRDKLRLLELERGDGDFEGIIGTSAPMRRLFRQLARVAGSDVTVLIQGDSGSGKELVAAALHARSSRANGPFVAVNSAAIPESLQESELFGHERGAFTSAVGRRMGRFEEANGGTLFLDEVADLSPSLQVKLLRGLQERTFRRVGGEKDYKSDFRLISASHKDLRAEVEAGRLREDLYYRLAVFELRVPALKERLEDIAQLAHHFLANMARAAKVPIPNLAQDALSTMMAHDWPGNVRELQNAIQHAFVLAEEGVIRRHHLPSRLRAVEEAGGGEDVPLIEAATGEQLFNLDEVERRVIKRCLDHTGGNLSEACRLLGCARTTLYRKIQKYSL